MSTMELTHRTWARLAAIALAVALVALASGCSTPTTTQQSTEPGVAISPGVPLPPSDGSVTGRGDAAYAGGAVAPGTPEAEASRDSADASAVAVDKKLVVVSKTLRIETADVQSAITRIRDLAARDGGDITSMQVSTSVDLPVYAQDASGAKTTSSVPLRAFVTVRVPAATYAAFIGDAVKLGTVQFQSESSDDVTQQHVDMQARLDNLKAEQRRLRQLFARANKVSDLLDIEGELTRVQGDIESMQAQIKYLERQAAMATVTIELVEPTPLVSPAGGTDWGVRTAFTEAIRGFVATMNELIVFLGPLVAMLVFVGLPVLVVVWAVRKVTRRRPLRTTAAGTTTSPIEPPPTPGSGPVA